jgi:hypothetical protein
VNASLEAKEVGSNSLDSVSIAFRELGRLCPASGFFWGTVARSLIQYPYRKLVQCLTDQLRSWRVVAADVHDASHDRDAVAAFLRRKAVEQSFRRGQHDCAAPPDLTSRARRPELRTFLLQCEAKRFGCLVDGDSGFESREVTKDICASCYVN